MTITELIASARAAWLAYCDTPVTPKARKSLALHNSAVAAIRVREAMAKHTPEERSRAMESIYAERQVDAA